MCKSRKCWSSIYIEEIIVKLVLKNLKRLLGWSIVFGKCIGFTLWSMWWKVWKQIQFEGLCLIITLLSCEVCNERFVWNMVVFQRTLEARMLLNFVIFARRNSLGRWESKDTLEGCVQYGCLKAHWKLACSLMLWYLQEGIR